MLSQLTKGLVDGRPFGFVSVREFGATGNGATDDSPAFNAASANLPDGSVLIIPPGAYRLNAKWVHNKNITILGYGAELISYVADDDSFAIGGNGSIYGLTFTLAVDKTARGYNLFNHTDGFYKQYVDCTFRSDNGFRKVDALWHGSGGKNYVAFRNCRFAMAYYSIGARVWAAANTNDSHITFDTCEFFYLAIGALISGDSGSLVDNVQFNNCTFFQIRNESGAVPDGNKHDYAESTVAASANAGSTTLSLASATGFAVGMPIAVGNVLTYEVNRIDAISGNILTLSRPLIGPVSQGTLVIGGGVCVAALGFSQNIRLANCHLESAAVGAWLSMTRYTDFDTCTFSTMRKATVRDGSHYTLFKNCSFPTKDFAVVRLKNTVQAADYFPANSIYLIGSGVVDRSGSISLTNFTLVEDPDATGESIVIVGADPIVEKNHYFQQVGSTRLFYRRVTLANTGTFSEFPSAARGVFEIFADNGPATIFSLWTGGEPREMASSATSVAYSDLAGAMCILYDPGNLRPYLKNNLGATRTFTIMGWLEG